MMPSPTKKIRLIATTRYGLEKIVKREVADLGFENIVVSEGKVEFDATPQDIPKANIWLRCAGRILVKVGGFKALDFDELFDQTKALPWENWITKDGKFTVSGSVVKSTIDSTRYSQSIVKKAVVERLQNHYDIEWFEETGAEYAIKVSILKDVVTLTIDSSGTGLHRRGYRREGGEAPLKESLAAALVLLSFWNKDRMLIDPMCGSGTILIEAAMIARNIAPGLNRTFAAEGWPLIGDKAWSQTRRKAKQAINKKGKLQIFGYDIDVEAIEISRRNAELAGVGDDIVFAQKDIKDLWIDQQYGILISNPPYGFRLSEFQQMNQIYITLHKMFRKKKGWSVYILTADGKFPDYFKRAWPDRKRKLFNGNIEAVYYQYYGERPGGG